ncbi:hypothetical protein SHIRM173S_09756 [Streptomyces hirsutus]
MLARVERRMTGPDRPVRQDVPGTGLDPGGGRDGRGGRGARGGRLHGGVRGEGRRTPPQRQVAVSPATASAPPSAPAPKTPDAVRPSAGSERSLGADGAVNPHSNEFWAQSDVALRTGERLTALTVRLRVAQTGGVSSTGAWRSLPEEDFVLTVGERAGSSSTPGHSGRVARSRRASGCSPASTTMRAAAATRRKDTCTATAATAGGERLSVKGGFTADDADAPDSAGNSGS